jgi:hypothetical protein
MTAKAELIHVLHRLYNERDGFSLCLDSEGCEHCLRIKAILKDVKGILKKEGAIP